jgi:twitching motility protein PilT
MADKTEQSIHIEQTLTWLHGILALGIDQGASDVFFKTGAPPALRVGGEVNFLRQKDPVSADRMRAVTSVLVGSRMDTFREEGEVDTAYEAEEIGRFRVNVFRQRERTSAALRHIARDIPSFEDLDLPAEQLRELAAHHTGMILVTGVTGSGKSTTLASMIDYMNDNYGRHIVTIEDPVEYIHSDRKCLIEQREVGLDTASFRHALKHVVRQSPDAILVGEMRDRETIETAINAAEIGHLVMSTLHTASAARTLERIVSYFPPYQHELIRLQLSNALRGILSQKLLVTADGKGRVPAVEVMMRTPTICDLIQKDETQDLIAAMQDDRYYGCQTFQQALIKLCREGRVKLEEALRASPRPQELRNALQGLRLRRE